MDQALISANSTGTHFYTAETLRLRGELREEQGDAGGEADLRRALELARRQGARTLEDRVLVSLERSVRS
jgi:hypothetical protein